MALELKVYNNGDHTCLIWYPADAQPIPDCRGFGVRRLDKGGQTQYLHNFVGFAQGDKPPALPWQWPLQRFMWWDYDVQPNDVVQYTIVPVVGSYKSGTLKLAEDLATSPSPELTITGQDSRDVAAYFNRGIIATQWVARELAAEAQNQKKNKTTLMAVVEKVGDPLRNSLSGQLRPQVLKLLQDAKAAGGSVFAALYELNDPELIKALTALGPKANLILANGAFKPPANDENAAIRAKLKKDHKVNVFDRLVSSGHFAHNKFLVVCDAAGKAQQVLTGSTNWTVSGLCTQANNGLIISDPAVADAFLQQWHRLQQAGNGFPATLVKANSAKKTFPVDGANVSVWFAPTDAGEDLQHARSLINHAKHGILFLFFNPGAFEEDPDRQTLLQTILNRHREGNNPNYDPNLYIKGVVNQEIPNLTEPGKQRDLDPSAPVHPVVLFNGGANPPERLTADVTVPAAIKTVFSSWQQELLGASMVMIHSKVIVIDPFGEHPVLMTGSHNLGFKASAKNDDNLVIVENNPALAAAYAVNIIAIFHEYRWRHYVAQHAADPKAWTGLADDDRWQNGYLANDKQELAFWLGNGANPAAPTAVKPRRKTATGK